MKFTPEGVPCHVESFNATLETHCGARPHFTPVHERLRMRRDVRWGSDRVRPWRPWESRATTEFETHARDYMLALRSDPSSRVYFQTHDSIAECSCRSQFWRDTTTTRAASVFTFTDQSLDVMEQGFITIDLDAAETGGIGLAVD